MVLLLCHSIVKFLLVLDVPVHELIVHQAAKYGGTTRRVAVREGGRVEWSSIGAALGSSSVKQLQVREGG